MAITVQQIKDQYTLRKVDINDVSDQLFIYWCDYVNKEFYRFLLNTDVDRYMIETTYAVSTSPSEQAIPADFRDIAHYGAGFYLINANGVVTTQKLPITRLGSISPGVYMNRGNFVFTGITNTTQFRLRYVPQVDTLSELDDEFIVPEEYSTQIQDAVDKFYEIWDEDPSAEFLADQRYARSLSQIMATIPRIPKVYGLQDVSVYF